MNTSEYFVWNTSPVAFTIPEISLPFSISIYGLILAIAIYYFGSRKIWPELKVKDTSKTPDIHIPVWKPILLFIGALIIGQLPFLIIDSPSISSIGPIQPYWYGIMFASGFIFGYLLTGKLYRDAGRTQEELDRILIYVLVATVIGARLGHVIFYDLEYYLRNPMLIPAVWQGGLASHGAAVAILIAMYLYVKRTPNMTYWWLADRVVPGVAVGGMFIRIGNFFNSEILGRATDVSWAVIFERVDMTPRHPTMLYESLSCVIVLIVLMIIYYKYDKKPPEGSIFGSFLVVLFTGRFLLEFTKIPQAEFAATWALNMGQLLSIPLVIFGIWLLVKKVKWR
ncbi:MAG: prolipoprotein diacylglyceryl transferase [Balneolaceae bacterium]